MSEEKKVEGFFSRGLFLIKHHLKRGDDRAVPIKQGGICCQEPCLHHLHNEHKIKEKQIDEDKIDLFYEKLDIHGKKGGKKESVGGGM